jgi:hypothetical protein
LFLNPCGAHQRGFSVLRRRFVAALAVFLVGFVFSPGAAKADFVINTDGSNTSAGGANATTQQNATVNAQVDISFAGNGDVTITLKNMLSSATDVGQSITGIKIVTLPSITMTSSLTNTYGQLFDSPANPGVKFVETGATGLGTGPNQGQFVGGSESAGAGTSYFDGGSGSGHNAVAASNWNVTSTSPGIITVLGSGQPTQSVISAAGEGSGFNSGITHRPVYDGSVTLVAGTTGFSSSSPTTISQVTFYFGTGTDSLTVNGQGPTSAPAPPGTALALCGIGFVGVWQFVRRKPARPAIA